MLQLLSPEIPFHSSLLGPADYVRQFHRRMKNAAHVGSVVCLRFLAKEALTRVTHLQDREHAGATLPLYQLQDVENL